MKIVVVATGTVGQGCCRQRCRAAMTSSRLAARAAICRLDIKDSKSIRALFEKTGKVDAVACTAGKVHFGDFAKLTETEMLTSLKDKFLGQVNLVLIGRDYVNDFGPSR
jgi:NADP-dependent 3-hydroxy acid dehydrogenase YdfG